MNRRLRVVLYGNSIILGTVGASLARYPDLEIIPLSPPLPGVEALWALAPHVILFDVGDGCPEAAFSLLKNRANLLLAGVNPESEEVSLWSSTHGAVMKAGDLRQLISQPSFLQESEST